MVVERKPEKKERLATLPMAALTSFEVDYLRLEKTVRVKLGL